MHAPTPTGVPPLWGPLPLYQTPLHLYCILHTSAVTHVRRFPLSHQLRYSLQSSREVPWTTVQRKSQAMAVAQSLSLLMDAHSPTPQVSLPCGDHQTPIALPFAFI